MSMSSIEDIINRLERNREMPETSPSEFNETPTDAIVDTLTRSDKRSNRMILIGAPDWVRGVIHRLHGAGITEVKDWTRLTPTRNPDEVMSLMQRPRVQE